MTAAMLSQLLTTGLTLAVGVLAFLAARRFPKTAASAAVGVLCLVPVWIGVELGFNGNLFVPLATVAVVAVALALLPVRGLRPSLIDAMLVLVILCAAASLLTSDVSLALSFLITPFTAFVGGYLFGRIGTARFGTDWLYGLVAIACTVVAVLAIIEFVSGWNPFIGWSSGNSLYTEWGSLQERGGVLRAEGAFGHSIALGASLALAAPLVLASRFPATVRLAMTAVLSVAVVLTFSRISIVCLALGLVLCVLAMREQIGRGIRVAIFAVSAAAAAALAPLLVTVFSAAGDEAVNSAGYRGDLVSLLQQANLVGFSDSVRQSARGVAFGQYRSIDSQLILTALSSGILSLVIVSIALLGAILLLLLRGRAQPATIAVIAQIPALATVALITQYSVFLWLVIGIAATSQLAYRAPAPMPDTPLHFPMHRTPGVRHDRPLPIPLQH